MPNRHRAKRDRNHPGLLAIGIGAGLAMCLSAGVLTATTATSVPVTYNPDYTCKVPWLAGGSATIPGTGVTVTVTLNNTIEDGGHYLYQSSSPAKDKTTLTFSPPVPAIQMVTTNHMDAQGSGAFETLKFTGTGGTFTNAVTNQDGPFTYASTGVGSSTFSGMLSGLAVDYTFDAAGIGNSQRGSYLDMYISCVRLTPSTQTITGQTGTAITSSSALAQTGFVGSMTYAVTSGTLPAGLSLDNTTGVISGTPTATSSTTVTITATGSTFGSATATVTFAVTAPASRTVTFDANGGSGSMSSQSSASAANLTANAFTRSGFTFGGWNTAANGLGTPYANQASYSFANSVTLYAQWLAVPAPPAPAPPAPVVEEAAPPVPSPSPSASALPNLDPINNPQNRGVPVGGVPVGQSLHLLNGVPTGVRVVPNAPSAPTGLDVSGDGFFMRISGRGGNGDPMGLGGQAQLVLQSLQSGARSAARSGSGAACVVGRPLAESSGTGFKAGTQVRLYLLPGTLLGTFAVDGSGGYSGSVPVPVGLPLGGQTLQANGYAPSGVVRSVSLGVQVVPVKPLVSRKASARVFFDPNSPVISKKGRRALDALAKRAGRSGKRAVVVGFVQQTSSTSNDQSLSTRRAQAVAAYLRSKGVKGSYQVRGEGIAGPGNDARRVNITITYQPGC